jgi:phage shock protein C
MLDMKTKLSRSRTDAMIGGVCGGLGQYLGLDPTLVRLFFVLLAIGNGVGVLIYFLLWIIVPREGQGEFASGETIRAGADEIAARARSLGGDLGTNLPQAGARGGVIVGAALIVVGVIFFLENLRLPWLWWLNFDALWPLLLIAGGAVLLLRRTT